MGEPGALPGARMYRVELRPLKRDQPHTWRGWAADATDASARAIEDGRQRWKGYSFVIRAVVQVGA